MLTCVEICAGAGGQALGLEMAGFSHIALVEYEEEYCEVLRANRPEWNVICADVHNFDGTQYRGVDLFAGGVPFALYELMDAVREYAGREGREDIIETLENLVDGKRLKDISDLPMDLCC